MSRPRTYDLANGIKLTAFGDIPLTVYTYEFILGDMPDRIPYTMATEYQLKQIWGAKWPNRQLKYRILANTIGVDFLGMFLRRYNQSVDWHDCHNKKR